MKDADSTTEKKNSFASSNDTLCLQPSEITYKAYFFTFFGAIGSSNPYLALYFKQLGLTAGQAGVLIGVRLFTEFIGAPLWGMVGDKYKTRKIILFASLVSFSTGTLLLLAVQPQNQKCIETGTNNTAINPLIFPRKGGMILGDDNGIMEEVLQRTERETLLDINSYTSQQRRKDYNNSQATSFTRRVDENELTHIFMIFLAIIFASQIVGSVVYTIPEALVVGFLKENLNRFGTFRMWGEVGIATGSFIVGAVIGVYNSEVCGELVKNYNISFYFFAGFIALSVVILIFLEVKYSDHETSHNVSFLKLVKELLTCYNLIFVALSCYFGFLNGFQVNFGLWYLDDLGAQPYMLGLAAGFRYTIAFLAYLFSGTVINKIGLVATLTGCLLLYVADFAGLAFVLNPWLGVALFSFQGMIYGLGWSACVVFGATVSLKIGFYAAIQGLLGGLHWGLGAGSGIAVSGVIINSVGIPNTYFIYSMTSFVMLVLLLFNHGLKCFRERKKDTDEASYKLVPTKEQDD